MSYPIVYTSGAGASKEGLSFRATCSSAQTPSKNIIVCPSLIDYGSTYFANNYYMSIIKNVSSIGFAPENETKKIVNYTSTGTFTTLPFSANVELDDEVLILHKSLVENSIEPNYSSYYVTNDNLVPGDFVGLISDSSNVGKINDISSKTISSLTSNDMNWQISVSTNKFIQNEFLSENKILSVICLSTNKNKLLFKIGNIGVDNSLTWGTSQAITSATDLVFLNNQSTFSSSFNLITLSSNKFAINYVSSVNDSTLYLVNIDDDGTFISSSTAITLSTSNVYFAGIKNIGNNRLLNVGILGGTGYLRICSIESGLGFTTTLGSNYECTINNVSSCGFLDLYKSDDDIFFYTYTGFGLLKGTSLIGMCTVSSSIGEELSNISYIESYTGLERNKIQSKNGRIFKQGTNKLLNITIDDYSRPSVFINTISGGTEIVPNNMNYNLYPLTNSSTFNINAHNANYINEDYVFLDAINFNTNYYAVAINDVINCKVNINYFKYNSDDTITWFPEKVNTISFNTTEPMIINFKNYNNGNNFLLTALNSIGTNGIQSIIGFINNVGSITTYEYSPSIVNKIDSFVGIALSSASAGDNVNICTYGKVKDIKTTMNSSMGWYWNDYELSRITYNTKNTLNNIGLLANPISSNEIFIDNTQNEKKYSKTSSLIITSTTAWVPYNLPNKISNKITVILCAGGGGGGMAAQNTASTASCGGGGEGGAVGIMKIDISNYLNSPIPINITIGTGGLGVSYGAGTAHRGGEGGLSSFDGMLTVTGGAGGFNTTVNTSSGLKSSVIYPNYGTILTTISTGSGNIALNSNATGFINSEIIYSICSGAGGGPGSSNNIAGFGGTTYPNLYNLTSSGSGKLKEGNKYGSSGGGMSLIGNGGSGLHGNAIYHHPIPGYGGGGAGMPSTNTAYLIRSGDGGPGVCIITWENE